MSPIPSSSSSRSIAAGALPSSIALVVSCEHGGNQVPAIHASLFDGAAALLDSHRGWDPGALDLARRIAARFDAPLLASTTTRLLVDLNRSVGHRQLFSGITRPLPAAQRDAILEAHYRPHRDAVEGMVGMHVAAGDRVVHVASHSFTPILDGIEREVDIGWLYDPRRPAESAFAARWMHSFGRRAPGLRLRRNQPYRGRSDGLASLLRTRHADPAYAGIELEVNQRFFEAGGPRWVELQARLVDSLAAALDWPMR
ncbi:MAG: N-formylglutamate amidohydrolase [Burkholderiales bacterium]|nr:N-formylglutamate amidohydrolase [Burkholderiales bacterium]